MIINTNPRFDTFTDAWRNIISGGCKHPPSLVKLKSSSFYYTRAFLQEYGHPQQQLLWHSHAQELLPPASTCFILGVLHEFLLFVFLPQKSEEMQQFIFCSPSVIFGQEFLVLFIVCRFIWTCSLFALANAFSKSYNYFINCLKSEVYDEI